MADISLTELGVGEIDQNSNLVESQERLRDQIIESVAKDGLLTSSAQIKEGGKPLHSSDLMDSVRPLTLGGVLVFRMGQKGVEVVNRNESLSKPTYAFPYEVKIKLGNIEGIRPLELGYEQEVKKDVVEDYFINLGLYQGMSSVLPVVAERANELGSETAEQMPEILEERFANSFLVVTPLDKIENVEDISGEVSVRGNIKPDQFSAILIPESLYDKVAPRFAERGIRTIRVAAKKVKLFQGHFYKEGGKALTVPDYEREVRELLRDSEIPLFLHGVRLPTREDVNSDVAIQST